jgi:pimeloyl-ACP methyl ester carboxylesterase
LRHLQTISSGTGFSTNARLRGLRDGGGDVWWSLRAAPCGLLNETATYIKVGLAGWQKHLVTRGQLSNIQGCIRRINAVPSIPSTSGWLLWPVLLVTLHAPLLHPETLAAQEGNAARAIPLVKGLRLNGIGSDPRTALHRDAWEFQLLTDPTRIAELGQRIVVSQGQLRTWEAVQAAEDGAFAESAGSYLQFVVERSKPEIWLLDAHGHSEAFVNGEPRAGDPYNSWNQLPVQLEAGRNQLLFRLARGPFQGQLVPPAGPISLDPHDATLPDWIRGTRDPVAAAMPVINATPQSLEDLEIECVAPDGTAMKTAAGPILPLTLRKLAFQIPPLDNVQGGLAELTVRLSRHGAPAVLDEQKVTVQIRRPSEQQKRSFVSGIDGSVQYFAVTPARPDQTADGGDLSEGAAPPEPGLFLTLHGAGVEASGQAAVYAPKHDGHIVAPTNRRPFGFDWEDWGRIDALEVLELASELLDIDRQRVYLTGHSMGGHGTWQVGAIHPDRFAALGPSAGWVSVWSYAGAERAEDQSPVAERIRRAALASDTLALANNYRQLGVYVLHGEKDDNVPVEQARIMRKVLAEFHPDFTYFEQPGAGHWWGNECCDWPPMFEFFRRHALDHPSNVSTIDFTTVNPGISSRDRWVTICDQQQPLLASRLTVQLDRKGRRVMGTAQNIRLLHLDLSAALAEEKLSHAVTIELDGQSLTAATSDLWLACEEGRWRLATKPSAQRKGPHRYGPFKSAFDHRFVFVYGTRGDAAENEWSLAKARYDGEVFWYRGNGSIDIVPDTEFSLESFAERGVILYGNRDTNAAWPLLLGECPLQVRRDGVTMGERSLDNPRLATLLVYPRSDSQQALVGVVGGTGIEGLRATNRLRYFISGVGFPDVMIMSADFLVQGTKAVLAAGYWSSDWDMEGADIAWREG